MRVSHMDDEVRGLAQKRMSLVSIGENYATLVLAVRGKSAEKYPRGAHHEMRARVFTASLSSLSRRRAIDPRIGLSPSERHCSEACRPRA
jgi:hypothetical protein